MPVKCSACVKLISPRTDLVLACSKCRAQYHPAGVCFPIGGRQPKDWVCPECGRALPRDNRSETSVKGLVSEEAALVAVATSTSFSGLSNEMRLFREELIAMRNEIREFRVEFSDLRAAMCTVNERIGSIEGRMDAMEKQVTESTNYMSTRVLEEAIENLQYQLRERDQDLLANDVQVSNVPEMPAENLTHLAILIGVKLGLKLDERDVVSAVRMGVRRETGGATGRPRPTAVRPARRAIRDDLLRAARVRREVTTDDLGLF